jgi:hypothetical protein
LLVADAAALDEASLAHNLGEKHSSEEMASGCPWWRNPITGIIVCCARAERARRSRAAEQRDELAASYVGHQASSLLVLSDHPFGR